MYSKLIREKVKKKFLKFFPFIINFENPQDINVARV